jgi:hypothetical protein
VTPPAITIPPVNYVAQACTIAAAGQSTDHGPVHGGFACNLRLFRYLRAFPKGIRVEGEITRRLTTYHESPFFALMRGGSRV